MQGFKAYKLRIEMELLKNLTTLYGLAWDCIINEPRSTHGPALQHKCREFGTVWIH